MKNGVGVAQNIVLFGGTSEIGQAIIQKIVKYKQLEKTY